MRQNTYLISAQLKLTKKNIFSSLSLKLLTFELYRRRFYRSLEQTVVVEHQVPAEEIKGLEFKYIICYRLFDDKQGIWKKINDRLGKVGAQSTKCRQIHQ